MTILTINQNCVISLNSSSDLKKPQVKRLQIKMCSIDKGYRKTTKYKAIYNR